MAEAANAKAYLLRSQCEVWKAPVDKLCHLDAEAFASPKHKSRTHVHEEVEVMLFSTITNRVLEQLDLSYILEIEDQYEELESFL